MSHSQCVEEEEEQTFHKEEKKMEDPRPTEKVSHQSLPSLFSLHFVGELAASLSLSALHCEYFVCFGEETADFQRESHMKKEQKIQSREKKKKKKEESLLSHLEIQEEEGEGLWGERDRKLC